MEERERRVSIRTFAKMSLLFLGMSLGLMGCGSTELEDRKFPLVLAIDKTTAEKESGDKSGFQITTGFQDLSQIADQKAKSTGSAPTKTEEMSWYEAFEENDASNPKAMDYNHMKAIILSRELLEDKQMLAEFLDFVKEQEVFARNTLLFTCDTKAAEILKLEGKLDMPVGTWLEELTADDREVKNSAIVTLGSLLNEYENRMENIYIPMLTAKEDTIKIEQYYVISAYENCGVVENDTFRGAMLLEGKMKQYDLDLENGEAIRLMEIRSDKSYEKKSGELLLTIHLQAEATLLNGKIDTAENQKKLKKRIQKALTEKLQYEADRLLWEMQVDIANGFYPLGGYNRELYAEYGKNITKYKQNLQINIDVDITPVME